MRHRSLIYLSFLISAGFVACSPATFNNGLPATANKVTQKGGTVPGTCTGEWIDPNGCITARCEGGVSNPRVIVDWSKGTNPNSGVCYFPVEWRNSNSLQRDDGAIHNGTAWQWVVTDFSGPPYSVDVMTLNYTDTDVNAGNTYKYRAKYRAEVPSDTLEIQIPITECTCGG